MRMITLGFFSHIRYNTASTSVRAPGREKGEDSVTEGLTSREDDGDKPKT